MPRPILTRSSLMFGFVSALAAGCGGGPETVVPTEETMNQTAMFDVGEALRVYQVNHGSPPKATADIVNDQGMDMLAPIGLQALRNNEVVVFWGTTLPDTMEVATSDEGHDTVLAFESQVPESGGLVLMVDRTVETMTAEEFDAAPKAGTVEPEPAS